MKMSARISVRFSRFALLLFVAMNAVAQAPAPPATSEQAAQLRNLIANSPRLPLQPAPIAIKPPTQDWDTDYVSSVAVSRNGTIYLLHRNLKMDPVVAIDKSGRILHSWGRGLYTNPHSIRIDPDGNIWTVDSGSSVVLKFSPKGKQLLRFEVGELPQGARGFRGTADIAFAPGNRLFLADGYGNARILEYNSKGERIREWGTAGTGPGQFHLPHSIAARDGILYVADRQNGRIQRFDLEGRYLGDWTHLGKTFSISIGPDGNLWIGTHPRNVANEAPGWLVNVDRTNGKVLGYVDSPGLHSVTLSEDGDVVSDPGRGNPNQVLWFRKGR
jgi:DNA-binding beta-propeller fold protein YncE